MLNATKLLADALGGTLEASYTRAFGQREPQYAGIIAEGTKLILERIGLSDALYHSAEHTALVTLVGQDILRGEQLRRDVCGGLAALQPWLPSFTTLAIFEVSAKTIVPV